MNCTVAVRLDSGIFAVARSRELVHLVD